jgi:hypothetical protein
MNKLKLYVFIFLSISILSSCNKDNGVNYIPEDAVIIAKINTSKIVKDAFLDFASETNLINDLLISFPEYEDFTKAGIDEINQFYFFAQIPSIEKSNVAALIPLKDPDLFKKFILNRFNVKIETKNSYEYININDKYVITWNKKIALFYYADKLNLSIVSDAIKIIDKDIVNISNKGDLYNKFNDSEDHILIWVNNINNSILKDKLEELNLPKDEVHSFTSINFNNGKIDIQSNSYYTDENTILKNILQNDKSIDSLIKSSGSEDPLLVASVALNLNGIIDFLNSNEELYNNLQANVPFVNIKDFINMFSGDFLLTFNGVEEEVVQFYDEKIIDGVLEVVPDEKLVKTPYLTYAIGLNDSKKLIEMLQPFLGMIPYEFTKKSNESIVFETDEEYHVSLQNNILFLGTSTKARKLIRNMDGTLNQNFKSKITKYPFYFYANIDGLAQTIKSKDNEEIMDLISSTFSKFELKDYSVEKNETNAFLSLEFKSEENSLLQLIKFYSLFSKVNKNQIL